MRRILGGQKRQPIYAGVRGAIVRAIDGAVDLFAPRLALDWRRARIKSAAVVAYEAARITPTAPPTPTASADSEILASLRALRDRSRTLVRDDPHAATVMLVHEEGVVGEGVVPRAACTAKATGLTEDQVRAWNDACNEEWARWAEDEADATEVGTFYDLQSLALRNHLQDGDSISHAVIDGDRIACEMLDADRIESPNGLDTDVIRGGIELDRWGRRVAFWVLPHHPDDQFVGRNYASVPNRFATTDERGFSLVQHVFKRGRAGQTRGVPLLTPAILYQRHLHHYLDSELMAARVASSVALFIKRAASATDSDILPVQDTEQMTGQSFLETIVPGTVEYLNEGEEPVPFNPNRPGSSFDPFVTRILRAISASSGLAYEVVCRDFGRMNLSSARALMRELRRGFDLTRRRLVRGFCKPWWRNVIRMAIGAGRLRPPAQWLDNPAAFLAVQWVAPAYGYIDPETDAKGSVLRVDANLSDPFQEAAAYGQDALAVLRRRGEFLKAAQDIEDELGLERGSLSKERPERVETMHPQVPGQPGAPAPGRPGPADPTDEDGDEPADDEADTE